MSNTEKAIEQLEKVAELFSTKSLPQVAAEAFLEGADMPSRRWSLPNRVYMMIEGTSDARGYRQWEAAGRHVKKGAKAIYILGPRIVTIKETNKETGEETSSKVLVGFKSIPVFKVEDTEGKPVKYVINQPPLPPLHEVAERWGIKVGYDATEHGEAGSYDLQSGEIRLCVDDPTTFFHELAHAAHARIEELKLGQDPEQECIAQLSACVLGRIYGMDADDKSWNYIAHYSESNTPEAVGKLIYKVLGKCQKVLESILQAA